MKESANFKDLKAFESNQTNSPEGPKKKLEPSQTEKEGLPMMLIEESEPSKKAYTNREHTFQPVFNEPSANAQTSRKSTQEAMEEVKIQRSNPMIESIDNNQIDTLKYNLEQFRGVL